MANTKNFKINNGIQPTAYHEGLGTVSTGTTALGYDLSVTSYDSKSFLFTSQETSVACTTFKPDGTKMFIVGQDNDTVYRYSLSTAFDVSTATYDSNSFSVSSQASAPFDVWFKPDGTIMYVVCNNTENIYQYTLSTAWDLSTASYANKSLSTVHSSTLGRYPRGMMINDDGTSFYAFSSNDEVFYQYDATTAYDVSTASYASKSFDPDLNPDSTPMQGASFNADGTELFVAGRSNDNVYRYDLSSAYDISTASYSSISGDVSAYDANPNPSCVRFSSDGTKMFVTDFNYKTVYQFTTGSIIASKTLDMSTGTVFEITPTADTQIGLSNPPASGTVSQATLVLTGGTTSTYDLANASDSGDSFEFTGFPLSLNGAFIKPDGTKFYLSSSREIVIQYDVPGNRLNGITLETRFDAASQVVTLQGLFIDSGGTRMYLVCSNTDTIYQYTLSTAYDVSTASYDSKSFSVASQETVPQSVSFKPDGTKMYVMGTAADAVFQYSLSTAWDISTASYDSVSFSVAANPKTLTFKPDGTQFFVTDSAKVRRYDLSTAWDMSTASDPSVDLDLNLANGQAAFFNNDGNALYVFSSPGAGKFVQQYNAGTMAAITYDSSIQFAGGTAPSAPTTAASESDIITFTTRDGGTTYQGVLAIDGAK